MANKAVDGRWVQVFPTGEYFTQVSAMPSENAMERIPPRMKEA
jgi:hypothetical protein